MDLKLTNWLLGGALAIGALSAPQVSAATECSCSCTLPAAQGFAFGCMRDYQSPDNGLYYCYDNGTDYRVQIAGTMDDCLAIETQNVPCSGWRVNEGPFDNDPLNPPPLTPLWVTGGTLNVCGSAP